MPHSTVCMGNIPHGLMCLNALSSNGATLGKVVEHSEVDLSRGSGFSSLALLPVYAMLPDCRCNMTSQPPALASTPSLPHRTVSSWIQSEINPPFIDWL